MRTLGIDVSHHQDAINWKSLYDGGFRFVTVKVSQGDYLVDHHREMHLKGASDAGFITGAFFWVDPLQTAKANCDKALEAGEGLPITYWCPDVEQFWTNWESWRKWNVGLGPEPPRFDKSRLALHTVQTMNYMKQADVGPIKLYTRKSFITEYMPSLVNYPEFKTWELYLAQYIKQPPKGTKLTYEEVKKWVPVDSWVPSVPTNAKPCRMLQWSGDSIILPAYLRVLDLDYFDGTEAEMKEFFGVASQPTPIEPTHDEKVEILWKDYLERI